VTPYAAHKARCVEAVPPRCIQRGCHVQMADGSLLCERHWDQHKERARVSARGRRNAERKQLVMLLSTR
jgi:hypothetical protein